MFITRAKVCSAFNHISELCCAWLVKRDFVHQKISLLILVMKKKLCQCFMFLDLPQVVLLQCDYLILLQARITLNWTEAAHFIFGLRFEHYAYSLASFVALFYPTGFKTFPGSSLHSKLHTVCRHSKPKQSHILCTV